MRRFLLAILVALAFALPAGAATTTTPSSTTWDCEGWTDFTPSFPFVTYQHVTVTIDSVEQVLGTDYTWFDADTIRLNSTCSAPSVLSMVRDSDPSNPVVTFTSGSRLTANLLNDALLQNIYAMEEIEENTTVQGMNKLGGHWDADSLRIQNCSNATGDTDVACFGQLTIANADKYPGTATDNKIVKGDGTGYEEAETLPDAVAGDTDAMVQVTGAGALGYGPTYPDEADIAAADEKILKVNETQDGFELGPTIADLTGGDAGHHVVVNATGDGFIVEDWAPRTAIDTPSTTTADLAVAFTVPSDGTWDVEIHVLAVADGTSANCIFEVCIDEDVDGGGASSKMCGGGTEANEVTTGNCDAYVSYLNRNMTNGSTYTYDVSVLTSNEVNETPGTNCTDRGCHMMWGKMFRRE